MTKRSFFKRCMGFVACVALAPEIAFGVRLRMAELENDGIWKARTMAYDGNLLTVTACSMEDMYRAISDFHLPVGAWVFKRTLTRDIEP